MTATDSGVLLRPRWPEPGTIDPARASVRYGALADELVLYFGGAPVPTYVSPIDSPGHDGAAVMVGVDEHDASAGEVVGIHVMPLLAGAVRQHPAWALLAWGALTHFEYEHEMLNAAIAAFVAEVADLFDQHWTPPPPWEEQIANLAPRSGQPEAADGTR